MTLSDSYRPLCVVPFHDTKHGVTFTHPEQYYDSADHTDELKRVLSECNGWQTLAQIARRLNDLDRNDVAETVEELTETGILVDGPEVYRHFHSFTINPAPYSRWLSRDEVFEITAKPGIPLQDGVRHALEHCHDSTLTRLLRNRVSTRSFMPDPLESGVLDAILEAACSRKYDAAPSAGGLRPLSAYVILTRDHEGLPAGCYQYDANTHELIQLSREYDAEQLQYALDSDTLLHGAAAVLVIAADMHRSSEKYGNRGYRYTLLEAGHVAQNVYLLAGEYGIGCLEYGGFQDYVLAELMGLDPDIEAPVTVLGLGKPTEASPDNTVSVVDLLNDTIVGKGRPVRQAHVVSSGNTRDQGPFFRAQGFYAPTGDLPAKVTRRDRWSSGTGTSGAQAEVSAIAEGYERYRTGIWRVDARARADELSGPWVDPRVAVPWTAEQYERFSGLQPFDPRAEWEWAAGKCMRTGEAVMLPIDLVFFAPASPDTFRRRFCHESSSSGVAAHTDKHIATERALLELIERDALMYSWLTKTAPPRVTIERLSVHQRARAEYWRSQGREIHVLNHSEGGIAIANVIIYSEDEYPHFVNGAAASATSWSSAVTKALQEAELMMAMSLQKTRKPRHIRPEEVTTTTDHSMLYAQPDYIDHIKWLWQGEPGGEAPTAEPDSLRRLVDKLGPVMVDLSDPSGAPLSVVRVVCPELVPIDFGYGTEHYSHHRIGDKLRTEVLASPHYFG